MQTLRSFFRIHAKLVAGVLLLVSFSILAQTIKSRPSSRTRVLAGRLDMGKVSVSRTPRTPVTESEPGSQTRAEKPGPLTQGERSAVRAQLKSLSAPNPASIKTVANIPPAPPAQFNLSSPKPRSGDSWMTVMLGFNFPGGSFAVPEPHATINPANKHSSVILHFSPLIRNKTYMLDCAVSVRKKNGSTPEPTSPWRIEGDIAGKITPQSGHLLAGFIAAGTAAEIKIRPPSSLSWGYVYGCELTKVN